MFVRTFRFLSYNQSYIRSSFSSSSFISSCLRNYSVDASIIEEEEKKWNKFEVSVSAKDLIDLGELDFVKFSKMTKPEEIVEMFSGAIKPSNKDIKNREYDPPRKAKIFKHFNKEAEQNLSTLLKNLKKKERDDIDSLLTLFKKHKNGVYQNHLSYLMKLYNDCKTYNKAIELFNNTEKDWEVEPSRDMYSTLLVSYSKLHDYKNTYFYINKMIEEEFYPTTEDYNSLLSCVGTVVDSNHNISENIYKISNTMKQTYIKYNKETIRLMANAFYNINDIEGLKYAINIGAHSGFKEQEVVDLYFKLKRKLLL